MKHKFPKLLTLGLALLLVFGAQAQDAKSTPILEKLSDKMKKTPSFSADFNSKIIDKQADMEQSQKGAIKVSGDKFELQLGENTVLSDGNTVWTINPTNNEVMLDNLDEMFEDNINPTKLYTIWEEGYKYAYSGPVAVDKTNCDLIKLYPNDPSEKNYHTINMYITSSTTEVKKVEILGKDGTDISYTINNFKKENFSATRFHFDKNKHPGIELIDNR